MTQTSAITIQDQHPTGGNVVGEAARIDALAAGEILKVRIDLDDALRYVRGSWAANTEDRLIQVCYGLEALLRATSSLTLVVNRLMEQRP